jgi:hypothetical protein
MRMRHDEERKKMKQYEGKYLEEDEESVEEEANGLGKNLRRQTVFVVFL